MPLGSELNSQLLRDRALRGRHVHPRHGRRVRPRHGRRGLRHVRPRRLSGHHGP